LISKEESKCPGVFAGEVEVYLNKIYITQVLPCFFLFKFYLCFSSYFVAVRSNSFWIKALEILVEK
jgi:hypothetical protein